MFPGRFPGRVVGRWPAPGRVVGLDGLGLDGRVDGRVGLEGRLGVGRVGVGRVLGLVLGRDGVGRVLGLVLGRGGVGRALGLVLGRVGVGRVLGLALGRDGVGRALGLGVGLERGTERLIDGPRLTLGRAPPRLPPPRPPPPRGPRASTWSAVNAISRTATIQMVFFMAMPVFRLYAWRAVGRVRVDGGVAAILLALNRLE